LKIGGWIGLGGKDGGGEELEFDWKGMEDVVMNVMK
jgi:hypothetical protein